MKQYRVFISEAGKFMDSSKYKLLAEFVNQKSTTNYVRDICRKNSYAGKDIIIKVFDNDGASSEDGRIVSVISAFGEEHHTEE